MTMSLMIGPAFTIPGYTTVGPPDFEIEYDAPVHDAGSLVGHPGFWWYYLSGPLGVERESEGAFPVPTEEYDALCALLSDPERWPAVAVRLDGDVRLWVVFRNFEEDEGLDFVEQRPGQPAERVASVEGHGFPSGLSWAELLAVAALPDDRLTRAQRLLLMLPMLGPQPLPDDADAVLRDALAGVGAGNRSTIAAALVDTLDWRPEQETARRS
ncbi:hypothetical protein ACGFI9_13665 [Micromonospora sp. NPDC048930]|uniref:hypothetical protein n=1 Tax=Micromonospora sp. NPDC048930 TaxID=3364261 RepID=UPI00371A3D7B